MKRYLVLLVVIILAAGVVLFEEKHRAATVKPHIDIENHIALPESEAPRLLAPPVATKIRLADYADLWDNPGMKNPDPDQVYASLTFQKDLAPAGFEKIHAKPDEKTEPVLTVQDREAAYAIFSAGGFRMTLNLKPAYATPEASLPNHVNAGIGGSFSF
jgi:hypothetical protein